VSSILERLVAKSRTHLNQGRAYKILNTFSIFMGQKKHFSLATEFEDRFPKLFNFKSCALLFVDSANGQMYRYHARRTDKNVTPGPDDDRQPIKVCLPRDRGITGLAIRNKDVMVVPDGDGTVNYLPEVDNAASVPGIRNMIMGPCFD